jgi:flagellar biogenesis protein FliO
MIADAATDTPFSALALIALVGLLVAAVVWWQRSRGRLAGGDAIRLLSVRGLGGKRLLALAEVERERFLLGLTDERIACLARVTPHEASSVAGDADAITPERAWGKRGA